jgi:hypothetical protein
MSERSELLRKHARDATRNTPANDDRQVRELSLGFAQACIALARNEEWLEGEVSPVEEPQPFAAKGREDTASVRPQSGKN